MPLHKKRKKGDEHDCPRKRARPTTTTISRVAECAKNDIRSVMLSEKELEDEFFGDELLRIEQQREQELAMAVKEDKLETIRKKYYTPLVKEVEKEAGLLFETCAVCLEAKDLSAIDSSMGSPFVKLRTLREGCKCTMAICYPCFVGGLKTNPDREIVFRCPQCRKIIQYVVEQMVYIPRDSVVSKVTSTGVSSEGVCPFTLLDDPAVVERSTTDDILDSLINETFQDHDNEEDLGGSWDNNSEAESEPTVHDREYIREGLIAEQRLLELRASISLIPVLDNT